MKKKFKRLSTLGICIMLLTLVSCEKDYYDPSYEKEPIFTDVPADFDWQMTVSIPLRVEVNDTYNGRYSYLVEVYDANPIITPEARLLTLGVAKKGQPLETVIDLSKQGISTLYIAQVLKRQNGEERLVQACPILENSKSINCSFIPSHALDTPNAAQANKTKAASANTTVPTNAIKIDVKKNNNILTAGSTYVISEEYKGSIEFSGGSGNPTYLYVNSHWEVPSAFQMETGLVIIVLKDAKINFKNGGASFTAVGDAKLQINQGASFNDSGENVNLNFTNTTSLLNLGSMYIQDFMCSGEAVLGNQGELTADKLILTNTTNVITNNGKIFLKFLDSTNGQIRNNCRIDVEKNITLEGSTIEIASNSSITCKKLATNNSTINMQSSSIFEVENADFKFGNKIIGVGNEFALLRFTDFEAGWGGVIINRNIELENSKRTSNASDNNYCKIETPARMVAYGKATVLIPESECAGKGNTPESGQPIEPEFPIEIPQSDVYSYAMEDNWPIYGDYDMNDIVVDMKISKTLSDDNYVNTANFEFTLRAVGASKRIGAAIQLDAISKENVIRVSNGVALFRQTSIFDATTSNQTENGQKKVVLPIFDDAHHLMTGSTKMDFINTGKYGLNIPNRIIYVDVQFKQRTVTLADLSLNKINFFIITSGNSVRRTEVHLGGFPPTDKAITSQFGKNNDNSLVKYYVGKDNMVWGFCTPVSFQYPDEWRSILLAYPQFDKWVLSGGKESKDWYKYSGSLSN